MGDVKTLVKEFSTRSRKLVHSTDGKVVCDFSPLDGKIRFPDIRVLRFQHFFKSYFPKILDGTMAVQEAINAACADGGLNHLWINRHLKTPRYKKWVADRMAEIEAAEGITPAYIAFKHKMNVEGEISLSATQQTSLCELGDRVWPKVQKVELETKEKSSYSMDDLMQARTEVEALEAKLKEASKAA